MKFLHLALVLLVCACSGTRKTDECEPKLQAAMLSLAQGQFKSLALNKEIMDKIKQRAYKDDDEVIKKIEIGIVFNILAVRQLAPQGFEVNVGKYAAPEFCEILIKPEKYGLSSDGRDNDPRKIAHDYLKSLLTSVC